jgi:hypothetical protein
MTLVHRLERPFAWLWTHIIRPFALWLLRWARYAYYLRFSILLWWFPVLLVFLNSPGAARSLTSGIITPVTPLQYLCVTFFLISGSLVALILAHVVVNNGQDRFGDAPPPLLLRLLADRDSRWEWLAPVLSQFNNAFVVWYFFSNGAVEQVDARYVRWGVLGGTALAAIFWFAISAFYYLMYRPGTGTSAAARTLIFPRALLGLGHPGTHNGFGDVLEHATFPFSLGWLARFFPVEGYRWQIPVLDKEGKPETGADGKPLTTAGQLYEGHFFSLIAAVGFYSLYWVLWPITAPVLAPFAAAAAMTAYGLGALLIFVMVLFAKSRAGEGMKLAIWKAILGALVLGFTSALPLIYYRSDTEHFPILASVLILVISATWTFGGIAFFADRYRIPVLTTFIVFMVLPRVVPGFDGKPLTGAQEEHYLSYISGAPQSSLPTPGQVLDTRLRSEYCGGSACDHLPAGVQPTVIVVTSTGGGIHAAAWTTAVLGQLEQQFADQFHQHVVLLSTVSGGSVGLYDYLRELDPATNSGHPDWKRMNSSSRCSGLEGVGWGLVYYDIPKAVVPVIPYLISPSSGKDDLQADPLGKDRTWSLRRAMERNLQDPFCSEWAYFGAPRGVPPLRPGDPRVHHDEVEAHQHNNPDNAVNLTLAKLGVTAGPDSIPAFTMNTTTVEGGNRLLLSNYFVPRNNSANPLITKPAYSFLELYSPSAPRPIDAPIDLPLATAAQMSATFPYVSSAATLKVAPPQNAVHFVDGGYYDNDGTASAIEFLRYALTESKLLQPKSSATALKGKQPPPAATVPLRVVLVEIRNSPDVAANEPLVSDPDQGKPWNVVSQIVAPLQAFWSAGHGSVTARNRSALGLLEGAFHDQLVLQHFVIDDRATARKPLFCVPAKSTIANDPLNWYLTPCQQQEVDYSALAPYNMQRYKLVQACFANGDARGCPAKNQEERLALPH